MERLLVPAAARRVVEQGYDAVSGPVVRAEDHAGVPAADRLRAYALDQPPFSSGADPDHVDVVRFETTPLMVLTTPRDPAPRAGPSYPLGFLRDAVPVWELDLTRLPAGSRFVRVAADGQERELSVYDGPARGWRGATGYLPPLHLIGPRARWRDLDLPAGLSPDAETVELVWVGTDEPPEGFEPTRPRVCARSVPAAECEVFEVVVTARWRDVDVRVLQQARDEALLALLDPDVDTVNRLGAVALDPHLFEVTAPAEELSDVRGLVRTPTTEPR